MRYGIAPRVHRDRASPIQPWSARRGAAASANRALRCERVLHLLGDRRRGVGTGETMHEVDPEIDPGRHASGGDDLTFVDDALPHDLRSVTREALEEARVRRCP